MRRCSFLLAVAAIFLFLGEVGLAHRVNVFAFVDGDAVQVECGFSRSQKVKNGKLEIIDSVTGDVIAEGTTDARGGFRFRPSDAFLAAGHGLTIRLLAGEGHQDEWTMSPEELRSLAPVAAPTTGNTAAALPESSAPETEPDASGHPAAQPAVALSAVDIAQLEAVIGRVVDAKLAPVKQALLRQQDGRPGLRDIIGGLGWILGLLGLATYLKYRR